MVNGKEISPTATETEWTWDLSLPTCYASHPASEVDKEEKDLCEGGWCSDPTPDPKDPYPEACDDAYTECRHYVDESLIKTKASEIQFWNLHIPAKIVMHPKHHSTGRIMKEVSMTEEEADAMRKVAIANPDEDKYKPYLNPVFDDSASVYFSGQFLAIAGAASSLSELNFDLQAKSDGASSYSHDPAKAYRIRTLGDKEGLQAALLMPFAKNDDEKEWLRNLDINCPGWQYNDTRIGERAFTIVDSVDATLPDVIPNSPTDEKWKTLRQEKVPLPSGGYFVRNFYDDARILKAQKSIVRNNKFLYSDYFWKGCPDLENLTFKYTKSQIAQFLNLPVPVCNLKSLIFSPALYRAFSGIFSNPNEKREKALADKRVQEAQFLYKRNSKRERPETYTCPETALDILLSRWK